MGDRIYGFVKRRTFEMMLPDSGMESVASFRSQALNPQFSANLFGIYVHGEGELCGILISHTFI